MFILNTYNFKRLLISLIVDCNKGLAECTVGISFYNIHFQYTESDFNCPR